MSSKGGYVPNAKVPLSGLKAVQGGRTDVALPSTDVTPGPVSHPAPTRLPISSLWTCWVFEDGTSKFR